MDRHRAAIAKEERRTRNVNVIIEWINENDYSTYQIESINQSIKASERPVRRLILDSFIRLVMAYSTHERGVASSDVNEKELLKRQAGIFIPPPPSSSSSILDPCRHAFKPYAAPSSRNEKQREDRSIAIYIGVHSIDAGTGALLLPKHPERLCDQV